MRARESLNFVGKRSHFSNKLDDKLAHKVASQINVTHFCLVCQSEVCCKPKLVCYKPTKVTLRASLSSSLMQKCDGGNAPKDQI
jgi:hypothetical protein